MIDLTAPHHEELLRAEDMMQSGDYSDALDVVLDILSNEKLSDENRFHGRLLESKARIKLGNIDEAESSVALFRPFILDIFSLRLEIRDAFN